MLHFITLLAGVFFCSCSVIIICSSQLPPSLVASYRLLIASILMVPPFLLAWSRHKRDFPASEFKRCLIPAILLSIHFISWSAGARLTYIANASLIINLTPVAMPFLAHFLIREKVTRLEILGTIIAVVGVVILSMNAFSINPKYLSGNIVCFGSMIAFAAYLAYGRVNRDFPSIWLYMTPVYAISAALCFIYSIFTLDSISIGSWEEFGWMLALAIIPTMLGHVTLNNSLRHFTAQTFAVVNLHQFVFAGIMAWIIFDDTPPRMYYLAATLCITGAITVIHEATRIRREKRAREKALREGQS